MTWDDVRALLRQHLRVTAEDATSLGFRSQGAQPIKVAPRRDAFDQACVVVGTPVCELASLDPRVALTHNSQLLNGALVMTDQGYQLRHSLALEGLTWAVLARAIEFIAQEGLRLRLHLEPTPAIDATVFTNYAF